MLNFKQYISEEVTKKDLDGIEKFADKLFASVGIDVNFTRHFLDRVNDERNKKPINTAELTRLFKQTYRKHGKKIPKLGDDAQAVIHDMETDINMPFVLKYDNRSQEFDLVAKTIMRKKNFMTSNQKLEV
jgi:homoserine dehydrogenase